MRPSEQQGKNWADRPAPFLLAGGRGLRRSRGDSAGRPPAILGGHLVLPMMP
jgi:hypothetical protein